MWWFVDFIFYSYTGKLISGSVKKNNLRSYITSHPEVILHILFIYDLLLKIITNIILSFNNKFLTRINSRMSNIIFVSQNSEWKVVSDYKNNGQRKSDGFFDNLNSILKYDYDLIGLYPIDIRPVEGMKVFLEKVMTWNISHEPLNIYWTINAWIEQKKALNHFKNCWMELNDDPNFQTLCKYKENDLHHYINNELKFYFLFVFPLIVKYIYLEKIMLDVKKPNLVMLQNEYGWWERTLIVASKIKYVPTLAIQHGIIYKDHKGYNYSKGQISPTGDINSPFCPIADRTAVYGPYHKKLLTQESSYPEDRVIVTGQPRYDIFSNMDKIYKKASSCKKYGIDPKNKIILWTTGGDDVFTKDLSIICDAIKKKKNIELIIKQHPNASIEETNLIKKYISNYRLNAIIPPKKSDTYELLFICDLLLTKASTTAMEAVALDKPIIIFDFEGNGKDIVGYVKEGVALSVIDQKELDKAIETLLIDDSELRINRQRYISNYLYSIDGASSQRVVSLIKEMINSRTENS